MPRFDHLTERFAAAPATNPPIAGAPEHLTKPNIGDNSMPVPSSRPLPNVWQFTVDGKQVTAIDPDRSSFDEFLRSLHNKFGVARVRGLARSVPP